MIDRRVLISGAVSALMMPKPSLAQRCIATGRYSGPVVAELLPDGRTIKLTRPFIYTARCGKEWKVPVGARSDGASIPAFLWQLVGTPLVGRYRDAAVVHDWYCVTRTEPDLAVHQMFYEAMLTSGVSEWEAAKFYYGVRLGGPSWDQLTIANARLMRGPGPEVSRASNFGVRARFRNDNGPESKFKAAVDRMTMPEAIAVKRSDIRSRDQLDIIMRSAGPTAQLASADALESRFENYRAMAIREQSLPKSETAEGGTMMAAPAASPPIDPRPLQ